MKEYYYVNLYENKDSIEQLEQVDRIIVKKGLFKAQELLTGAAIDILKSDECRANRVIKSPALAWNQYYEKKSYFVKEDDLTAANYITRDDIVNYVDLYEDSRFKSIYEDMLNNKQVAKDLRKTIKQAKNMKRVKKYGSNR